MKQITIFGINLFIFVNSTRSSCKDLSFRKNKLLFIKIPAVFEKWFIDRKSSLKNYSIKIDNLCMSITSLYCKI